MRHAIPTLTVQEVGDRLMIRSVDRHLSSYVFQGIWKPYFYPLYGPFGNVVRGVNGAEHPNQYGLAVAYGGHSEGGSTNIWSDWDEPPYGPCGKILHEEFLRIEQHPADVRIVESLVYLRGDGTPMGHETRDIYLHLLPEDELRIDFCLRVDRMQDTGPRPLFLSARVADWMRVRDLRTQQSLPRPGRIRNSEGGFDEEGTNNRAARWCDYSGPVGEDWSGLALMDHPQNPGHPAVFSSRDYGLISVRHDAPADPEGHSLRTLLLSAYIHHGTADEGHVEEMYQRWTAGG